MVNNLCSKVFSSGRKKKEKPNGVLRNLNGRLYWKMKCVHPCQGVCQSPEQTCQLPNFVYGSLMSLPPERHSKHTDETGLLSTPACSAEQQ